MLREAGYMCQRCLLEGKRSQAEHVHHIFPREKYIEYEYERWNLIALCFRCHNKMHNRFNGNLSRTGEQLMRATGMMQGITVNKKKQTILVVGLRGAGKSTYVKRHLDDESLAYDMDAIASAFRLKMPHEEYYKPARRMANDFLTGFMAKAHDYVKTVYIIRTHKCSGGRGPGGAMSRPRSWFPMNLKNFSTRQVFAVLQRGRPSLCSCIRAHRRRLYQG